MKNEPFGIVKDGPCSLLTIENDFLSLAVSNYGATLVRVFLKDCNRDVILGFDSVEGYVDQCRYMSAMVGRVCNRIAQGHFQLGDRVVQLPINNGPNTLHGGPVALDNRLWELSGVDNTLVAIGHIEEKEDSFPGDLTVKVTYELLPDGYAITTESTCTKQSLCALTNHAYFNLNGDGASIENHEVKINTLCYSPIDANGLTLKGDESVYDTPFDFTDYKALGKDLHNAHDQIQKAHGYDHNFPIPGMGLRPMVTCQTVDLQLSVLSDLAGFHMYTGNGLGELVGKDGRAYHNYSGVCFETQYRPNAINDQVDEAPILEKGEIQRHRTEYHFKRRT